MLFIMKRHHQHSKQTAMCWGNHGISGFHGLSLSVLKIEFFNTVISHFIKTNSEFRRKVF